MKIVTASPTQVPHQGLHLAGENNNPFVVPSSIPTMDTLNFSQFSQGHAGLSFWYMKNISYYHIHTNRYSNKVGIYIEWVEYLFRAHVQRIGKTVHL